MRRAPEHLRHTTSHIMAQAIKRLYPNIKLAIGPSIADGFYYDVDSETPLTTEDLEKIEKEMKEDRKEDFQLPVIRSPEPMQLRISRKKMSRIR